jgi:hypothetical protein
VRIGVRVGPVWLSTSTRSRGRSQPSWHAKGHATTPDGREVDFRCHHSHRSQSAALDCASTIRKQIERGQNLHLVTRVRSTPASRAAARQDALRKEAKRQAKAAQRAQAAQQRAQRREAVAEQRAQQREALAFQRPQEGAEQRARCAGAAQQRAEYRERSAQQQPGQPAQVYRFNPPPNWPAPPPGWVPMPGWRPSPEWPAPPPGWQLWIDDTVSVPGPAFRSSQYQVDPSGRPSTARLDRLQALMVMQRRGRHGLRRVVIAMNGLVRRFAEVGLSAWELACHASLISASQVSRLVGLSVSARHAPILTPLSGTQRARCLLFTIWVQAGR